MDSISFKMNPQKTTNVTAKIVKPLAKAAKKGNTKKPIEETLDDIDKAIIKAYSGDIPKQKPGRFVGGIGSSY